MKKRETIRERYRAILSDKGYSMDECLILAFDFKTEAAVWDFHFGLILMLGWNGAIIFDAVGTTANVVILNEEKRVETLRDYAQRKGGKEVRPFLG